jgi:hypothetical protein
VTAVFVRQLNFSFHIIYLFVFCGSAEVAIERGEGDIFIIEVLLV